MKNLKIGTRLSMGFLFTQVLMALVVGSSIWGLESVNNATENLTKAFNMERDVALWLSLIKINGQNAIAMGLTVDQKDEKHFMSEIIDLIEENTKIQEKIENFYNHSPTAQEFLANIGLKRQQYIDALNELMKLRGYENNALARRFIDSKLIPTRDVYMNELQKFQEYELAQVLKMTVKITDIYQSLRLYLIAQGIVFLLIGTWLAYRLTKSITDPLRHAVQVAQAVALNDFSSKIKVAAKDEIGQLMRALRNMSNHLRKSIFQAQLAAQVFSRSMEGIIFLDERNNIIMVNEAFTRITGYVFEDVYGNPPAFLAPDYHDADFHALMWETINEAGNWEGELWNCRKDGSVYSQWASIRAIYDTSGQITHYIHIFTDLTERKENENQIYRLAHFDGLTGLPNHTLLNDRFMQAMSMAERRQESLILMYLDLDHFKNVNDSLGHHIGDMLLKQFAGSLSAVVRKQDTISRLGGDEFILLLPSLDVEGAAYFAKRLLHIAAQIHWIENHEITLSASIGIAVYPTDGTDFSTLSRHADIAMYQAKRNGGNSCSFFTSEMQANSVRLLQLDNALRHALEHNNLTVHYQPKMSLSDNSIVGFEALLRLHHPELGAISPAEFIPIAESNRQIIPIGEWVFRTALNQLKIWLDKGYGPMTVSINLSFVQLRQPRLSELIIHILSESGLSPENLIVEITESVAMENLADAVSFIDDLYKRGIRISIDDFGTGYSSLAYLKRFNVHKLKIDLSFIQEITYNLEDRAIVDAIISMAQSLHIKTIAEGVETAEQLVLLREKGCDEIQGYYLAKPLPANEAELFLENYHKKPTK